MNRMLVKKRNDDPFISARQSVNSAYGTSAVRCGHMRTLKDYFERNGGSVDSCTSSSLFSTSPAFQRWHASASSCASRFCCRLADEDAPKRRRAAAYTFCSKPRGLGRASLIERRKNDVHKKIRPEKERHACSCSRCWETFSDGTTCQDIEALSLLVCCREYLRRPTQQWFSLTVVRVKVFSSALNISQNSRVLHTLA
jgi:hypothetical protein